MIIVISYPGDPHAQRVIGLLQEGGHDVALLDISDLPDRAGITIDYDDPRCPAITIHRDREAAMRIDQATAVWWRRPQAPDMGEVMDPNARMFAANEWNEAINGLWQLLEARWVNPPARDEVASRKALQLRIASECGLAVPRTLITSDPSRAQSFIESQGLGRTVFKTFSATHAVWRETRLVRKEEMAVVDTVRTAPVIFQEYVRAEADLRVTVVGDRIFPAAIYAGNTDYPVDFRMSLGQARVEPTTLPDKVAGQIREFMNRLGLIYGAIDMRRSADGKHVFLEINTAGEFLFIEERTGLPISKALAEWLARPS